MDRLTAFANLVSDMGVRRGAISHNMALLLDEPNLKALNFRHADLMWRMPDTLLLLLTEAMSR